MQSFADGIRCNCATLLGAWHLRGGDAAEVLAKAKRRIERILSRAKVRTDDDAELALLASVYNLYAATTAGATDARGREALVRYILRPL